METKKVFCGICEAWCGLEATVEGGEVVKLRPDAEHPHSRGFACSKGISFPQVVSDPDRVVYPQQRQADGSFRRVSWGEALDDIGRRLGRVIEETGGESVGVYVGNPNGWNPAGLLGLTGLAAAMKTKHLFSASSVDTHGYFVVGQLLYGNAALNTLPDLHRTDFFLCLGANPLVSHGSMMGVGRVRDTLRAICERGGRVVMVDPRRTETAELFEHVPIRPDGDPWLLAAMLKVILSERLEDRAALAASATGYRSLGNLVAPVDLDRAARETGIPADAIARLAREFAAAATACAYIRFGPSTGPFATLTKYLVDTLNIVTGNFDRPGGVGFGRSPIDNEKLAYYGGLASYDRWRTRVDGYPEVSKQSPVAAIPGEIETPGAGQLRALVIGSGNLARSAPSSRRTVAALRQLALMVSIDPYINETSELADYVLPPALWLEREGFPLTPQAWTLVPTTQWNRAVVPPRGEARDEWWILDEIAKRIGVQLIKFPGSGLLARVGVRPHVMTVMDLAVRLGAEGDWFGLRRSGLSRRKLLDTDGAVKLSDHLATGVAGRRVRTRGHKVRLAHPMFQDEVARLIRKSEQDDPSFPLRLFSIRELRSHNSWMHNVPKLMAGDRVQRARIHPDDAADLGVVDGGQIEITSREGSITVEARVTDEVVRGAVGLPAGWAHSGTWRRAVAAGGDNYNTLTPSDPDALDVPSGNAVFNGIRVRVAPAASQAKPAMTQPTGTAWSKSGSGSIRGASSAPA